jgi:hypothetical protein
MTRKALQLGFCLLVLAVLAAFTAPAAQAFDFSYTQTGAGGTMERACDNAVQKIKDNCDRYGPITTDPGFCRPLWGPDGTLLGWVCTCEATAAYCQILAPPSSL